jgi:hypothetical protein
MGENIKKNCRYVLTLKYYLRKNKQSCSHATHNILSSCTEAVQKVASIYFAWSGEELKHVSYCHMALQNVETKEQCMQWKHTHLPNKPKKFKTNAICQKADSNCFQGSSAGGIHAIIDHNVKSLLQNNKKQLHRISHSEQKA